MTNWQSSANRAVNIYGSLVIEVTDDEMPSQAGVEVSEAVEDRIVTANIVSTIFCFTNLVLM